MQATTTSLDAAREEVLETDNVQPRELHFTELPIRVTPEPEINFKVHLDLDPSGEFPLELTPYSLKTLSAAIGIPSAFLPKLSAKLVDELLKHFIEQTSEKRRANLIIKGSEVLAFTSPRFLPAKTTPLWDAVESKVNQVQVGELRLHHYRHTGITTQVGLSAGSRYELATPAAGEPIGVKFGVFFRNSLVRSHHTEVMPYIARLDKQCSIVLPYTDDEPALRLRLDEPSPEDWMSAAANAVLQREKPLFLQTQESLNSVLGDEEYIHALEAVEAALPGPIRDQLLEAVGTEPEKTLFGLASAVAVAPTLDETMNPDHALAAMRTAGRIIADGECFTCHRDF